MNSALRAVDWLLIRTRTKNRVLGLIALIAGLVLVGICPIVSADQQLFDRMNYVSMGGFSLIFVGLYTLFFTTDHEIIDAIREALDGWRNFCIFLLALVIGIRLGLLVWPLIKVPFKNPLEVVGTLAVLKFSPETNYLRFVVLTSLPIVLLGIALVLMKVIWGNRISIPSRYQLKLSFGYERHWFQKILLGLGGFTLFLFIANPLVSLVTTDWWPSPVDFLHEGETLTPAYNYVVTGGLWTASWFCHGVFFDPLTTVLGWKIFGVQSIGASFLIIQILSALTICGLGCLIVTASCTFLPSSEWTSRLLFSQIMLASYLFTLNQFQWFDRRDFPVMLGLCILLIGIRSRNLLLFFLAGTGSAWTYFYSIDRGAYYTAMVLAISVAWPLWPADSLKNRFAPPFAILVGGIIGWITFYLIFGAVEFRQFLINTEVYYQTKDLFDSFVFSLSDTSALLSITAISMQCMVLAWCLWAAIVNRDSAARDPWIMQAAFTLLAVFYFRSALGRSDQPHIEYASGFAFLGLAYPLVWLLREVRWAKFNLLFLTYFLTFNLIIILFQVPTNWKNIFTVEARARTYAHLPDSAFLSPGDAAGIAELQTIFRNETGVFTLNSEAILPYLIKKPSLGMNYLVWGCGSAPKRAELMATLQNTPPRYLIFDDNGVQGILDGVNNQQRFPEVRDYIQSHYHELKYVNRWQVYERNTP